MTSDDLAHLISEAADDKKAREVAVIDLRGKTTIADFFVVCEGDTDRQIRAIADSIADRCREHGVRPLHSAGVRDATWACIDYDSVIVHIFLPGERSYYDLDGLWRSAPRQSAAGTV